ncbi:MAG: tetratricopeptide repeat protein, partial [Parachlamydia sp.]|nr:tetratricopeptide repeat protein [Parachlamydia sp.]
PKKALPAPPPASKTASTVKEAATPVFTAAPAAIASTPKNPIPSKLSVEASLDAFQQAEAHYDVLKMASSLIDVSGAYIEKGEWTLAAKSLVAALGLYQKKNSAEGKKRVMAKMAELEKRYFEKAYPQKINPDAISSAKLLERKTKLEALRNELRQKCQKNGMAFDKHIKEFSEEFYTLLQGMFKDCFQIFGTPPCGFALLCLGLPGPKEIGPFAKIRVAILVKDNTPEIQAYCQTLVKWWSLQLIFLGETKVKTLFPKMVTYIAEGIQFDHGCEFTLEKPAELPLVKTPKQLASFQFARFVQENAGTAAVLRQPGLLYGDVNLLTEYISSMSPVLSSPSGKESLSIRQQRALQFLNGVIADVEPLNDYEGEIIKDPRLFNLETDLLKFLLEAIAGLSDYCGIDNPNVLEKLEALAGKKIISPEAKENLRKALISGMLLRCKAHLRAGASCDEIYHPRMYRTLSYSELARTSIAGEWEIEQIILCLTTIFSLQEALETFCRTQNVTHIAASKCLDLSALAKSRALLKLGMYVEARESLKTKPEPGTEGMVLYWQGKVSLALGNFEEALKELGKALETCKKTSPQGHPYIACIHEGMASAADALKDTKNSEAHLEEARNVYRKIYWEDHPFCAKIAYRLAYKKSWVDGLKMLQESFDGFKRVYGKEHLTVAVAFQSAGAPFCLQAKQFQKAIDYCDGARLIRERQLGARHEALLPVYAGLVAGHLSLNDVDKAIPLLQKEISLRKDLKGNILAVAKSMFHLAIFLGQQKNPHFDLFMDEAFRLARNVPDKDESHLLKVLEVRATLCFNQNDYERIIDLMQEAIRIRRKREKSSEEDLKLADDLYKISIAWVSLHNEQNKYRKKAIKALEEAFKLRNERLGAAHVSLYEIYQLLGSIYCGQGDKKKGEQMLRSALTLAQRAYGKGSDEAKHIEELLQDVQKASKS